MPTKTIRSKEKNIHQQVATYLKLQYRDVIFRTDFAAGIKMTIGQAKQHKNLQSCSKYPDVFIAEPRKGFHGLFLELKRSVEEIYKKDMTFRKNDHVAEQAAMLERLTKLGYKACFACGFDHAKKIIDDYLKQQ